MNVISNNRRLTIILLTIPVLLLIPLIGMQFSNEIKWSPFDFAVMGTLLLIVGLFVELALRKIKSKVNRIVLIAIIVIVFLLMWAELAVGIFGTPFAGN